MKKFSRREFVRNSVLVAAATQVPLAARAAAGAGAEPANPAAVTNPPGTAAVGDPSLPLHWVEGRVPGAAIGATWGMPWPRGKVAKDSAFAIETADGKAAPSQTWPLAYWPDGSLKWTAHAVGPDSTSTAGFKVKPGTAPATPAKAATVHETVDAIEVDTGVIRCRIARKGAAVIESITRDGREIARDGRLILLREDRAEPGVQRTETFTGEIASATVEQSGPVRVVVKLEGKHANAAGRAWLPFVVRLYFYAGGEAARVMHTFIFDGDEQKDFIRGLGVRFAVPMRDLMHDRHVRFAGEGAGLFAEGVRTLTGLRRDPGAKVIAAQLAGQACPPVAEWPRTVGGRLDLIPAFGDYTLFQPTADSFEIRKRTKDGHAWLNSGYGHRAAGLGYVGGATGGVAFGLRDFWQRHPTALEIRGATTERAEVTLWMWSPDAPAMDLRFYHDGMGQDTHQQQLQGLEITYEDYEPGFGTPVGVARTSELTLWACAATPSREKLVELADAVRTPGAILCRPEIYHAAGVFGEIWNLPDRSTPAKTRIEDQLDWFFSYYQKQVEQRHWYGFWNYGDVMHTYDRDRHTWRYDVGGFAWDNSELSTDLWLWYAFLRSGRADIFRFAEAMVRHTGEVDVYHLGRFAGLGSRHNVMHWGCSAKQVRIATAANRRFYYFLTGDERVGDLLREQLLTDRTLTTVNPTRKVAPDVAENNPWPATVSIGTDWTSLASAWLAEWERTGETKWRDKILAGMKSIGGAPHGWFSGGWGYEPATGVLHNLGGDRVSASHLNGAFGAFEVSAELIQLLGEPTYAAAWLQYCELYNASDAEQARVLGRPAGGKNLIVGHSRFTAYASVHKKDPALAHRAWGEFTRENQPGMGRATMKSVRIEGPAVLHAVDEAPGVSTNDTAQWCLAAMHNLALIGDALGETKL